MIDFLTGLLRARASDDNWIWFEQASKSTTVPLKRNQVLGYYTAASSRLGKQAVTLQEQERRQLSSLSSDLVLNHWGVDEIARVLLLLQLAHLPPGIYTEIVLEAYELGDNREQQSWLRGLSLLPNNERFLDTAIEACRTNAIPLLEAIACENSYPTCHFPELNFNQMVLKLLFNEIRIIRIIGLESRFSTELSRMADDYAREREAAGRTVPSDIWFVLAPKISPSRTKRIYPYLHTDDPEHRYWAAISLGHTRNSGSRVELEKLRKVETEKRVLAAIDASLARMVQ